LAAKVNEFKSKFLINKSIELMEAGTKQTKALTVVKLIQKAEWSELDILAKELGNFIKRGYGNSVNVKNIFAAKESELDEAIAALSREALRRVDLKELIEVSRNFKVDVKKHFKITEDYLKLYTKDQLTDLGIELKIDGPGVELKKGEIISHILNQKLKGKVPKIMI